MFERFSPNLMEVFLLADEEARILEQTIITPQHLLFGLLKLVNDPAADILRQQGINFSRQDLRALEPVTKTTADSKPELSESAKEILKAAYDAASALNSKECGTNHLLLAFLRSPNRIGLPDINASDIEAKAISIGVSETSSANVELFKQKVQTWSNRAEMAHKHGNDDLAAQALEQKHKYEQLLADLSGNT